MDKEKFTAEENRSFFEMDLRVTKLQEDIKRGNISKAIREEMEAKERIREIYEDIDCNYDWIW